MSGGADGPGGGVNRVADGPAGVGDGHRPRTT